jgi:hypothetical protein
MGGGAAAATLRRSGDCLQDAIFRYFNLTVTKTVLVAAENMS